MADRTFFTVMPPFVFTPPQRAEIRREWERVTHRSASRDTIGTLEKAIDRARFYLEKDTPQERRKEAAALAKLQRQLTSLIACLDRLPLDAAIWVDRGWNEAWSFGYGPPVDRPPHVAITDFYEAASAIRRVVRWRLSAIKEARRRGGRPVQLGRIGFADAFLRACEPLGVTFSKGHDSVAAALLTKCLDAVGASPPQDMWDLLRQVGHYRRFVSDLVQTPLGGLRGVRPLEERLRRPKSGTPRARSRRP